MKNNISSEADATLSAINAALYRNQDDLTWRDPEFQQWERDQVGDWADRATNGAVTRTTYAPGPAHRLADNDVGLELDDTVRTWPIIDLYDDHPWCACETDAAAAAAPTFRRWMTRRADDYPPPEHTTHGPLLLGPEPSVVGDETDRSGWQGATADLVIHDETAHYSVRDLQRAMAAAGHGSDR